MFDKPFPVKPFDFTYHCRFFRQHQNDTQAIGKIGVAGKIFPVFGKFCLANTADEA